MRGGPLQHVGGAPHPRYGSVRNPNLMSHNITANHDESGKFSERFDESTNKGRGFNQSVADQQQQHMLKVYLEKKERLMNSLKR
jgi:hypothetical protein